MRQAATRTDEIRRLESLLHDPSIRSNASRLDDLLADEFREFGSSGRTYSKADILAELPAQSPMRISVSDFTVCGLGPDVCLATYRATIESEGSVRRSLRSSTWVYRSNRWQLAFHQGTVVDTRST